MEKKKLHMVCDEGHEWLTELKESSCHECWKQERFNERRKLIDEFLEKFPLCHILAYQIYPSNNSPLYGLLREVEEHLQSKEEKVRTTTR